MVWYFIGVYIINRTLHGHLEIRNFSSRVEKIFHIFQHSRRNCVSPCGHVISSIYQSVSQLINLMLKVWVIILPSSVGATRKVSPNWSQKTMTCHSSNCFSIVWGQGNASVVTSLLSSCYMTHFTSFSQIL